MRTRSVLAALVTVIGCSSAPSTESAPTALPTAPPGPPSPIPTGSTELVTVVSATWDAVPAELRRYERSGDAWSPIGEPIPVVLGKTGLGWGIGLHSPDEVVDGPSKREGDGRSPAGVFALGSAFGYAPAADAGWLRLPYLEATEDLECVDDPSSSHYNQLLYRSSVASVDWTSSETMKRSDALYRWGVFVGHNPGAPVKNGGSCIFLHLWSGPSSATIGCTAGAEDRMKELFGWLDSARAPVLVQLPRASYDAVRQNWRLP